MSPLSEAGILAGSQLVLLRPAAPRLSSDCSISQVAVLSWQTQGRWPNPPAQWRHILGAYRSLRGCERSPRTPTLSPAGRRCRFRKLGSDHDVAVADRRPSDRIGGVRASPAIGR